MTNENDHPLPDGMVPRVMDIMTVARMRDHLSHVVKLTVPPEQFSVVIAAMLILALEAVNGDVEQCKWNIDQTHRLYCTMQEMIEASQLAKMTPEGKLPS